MRVLLNVLTCMLIGPLNITAFANGYTKTNELDISHPAFLNIDYDNSNQEYNLLINTFTPFGKDRVYIISNLSQGVSNENISHSMLSFENVNWPNQTQRVPYDVFKDNDYFTVAGGFLVPGKSNGNIQIRNTTSINNIINVTRTKPGFFYHKVIWADMNNDGKKDILTARANKPILGASKGELLWLEQPENPHSDYWAEHVIAKGPDVNFIYEDIDHDDKKEIIAAEFFSKRISILWKTQNIWQSKIIEDQIGAPFDLELTDLNNDGLKELLVTNHESSGSVFVYTIPSNPKSDIWKKITLLSQIKTTAFGFNQASPGKAFSFHPNTNNIDQKPSIIVAGDGSQEAYLLTPLSQDTTSWDYETKTLLKVSNGVIGQIAVGDIDENGTSEIFIPAYDEHKIHIFSLID